MSDIHEGCFLWENQSWGFSNSENSGGSNEKSGKKVVDSGSNSPTPTPKGKGKGKGKGKEVMVDSGKKRSKNGKGVSIGDQMNEGKGGGSGGSGGGGGGGGESDHEIHIWTERERRKKMRNMFSNLHALLPQLPPKADKSTIVDEAVTYIKTLQQTLQKLQKQKLERLQGVTTMSNGDTSMITQQKVAKEVTRESFMADQVASSNDNGALTATNSFSVSQFATTFQSWTSPNVILNVCGDEAQLSVCCPKKLGLLTSICFVLEKYKLEVVSAHASSDYNRSMYMFQVRASGAPDQFPDVFPVEEIYKLAAGEILSWLNC